MLVKALLTGASGWVQRRNLPTLAGETPLVAAASAGHKESVRLLLEAWSPSGTFSLSFWFWFPYTPTKKRVPLL